MPKNSLGFKFLFGLKLVYNVYYMGIDRITKILESAVRAPSTHNSQPWLFKITENKIEVFFNPKYVLPFADKETRDLHISIGCMLENFLIASLEENLVGSILYGPFENKTKLAEITLTESNDKPSELSQTLFKTIPNRVNARGIFLNEKMPVDLFEKINSFNTDNNIAIDFFDKKEDIKKVADSTALAMIDAYNQVGFRKEMSHWMNHNLSNKKEGLPGYSLNMPLFISLIIPLLIRYFNMGSLLAKLNIKSISSAPLIIIISGKDGLVSWMKIGRFAEKIMLYVQSLGYQTSIYVGSIEIGDRYKEIQELTNRENRPQFIFAVGHISGKHKITPRHKIEEKIMK
jgi:hypothetical protein